MSKAYSYLRFSTPEQARGDSHRRQTELARSYAVANGLELDQALSFRDMGVSGFSGANVRSGALGQFLRLIDDGLVDAGSFLLVENLDRVSRQNPWDALPIFQQIINAGVTIVTLQDRRVWSKADMRENPFRMFESLMVMIRAHEESATKSRRLREAWSNKRASAGVKALSARGPAWLHLTPERQWEVREDRAALVRRIFQMAADGQGQNAIAQAFNTEGVATWGDSSRWPAAHWHRSYVVKILSNPSVLGTYIPHTAETGSGKKVRTPQAPVEGYYPAVVDRELWDAVKALHAGDAASPKRGRHASAAVQNILGGLARCPKCGGTMTRTTKGSKAKAGAPYLICQRAKSKAGCRYRTVRCDVVEAALVGNVDWIGSTGPAGGAADELASQIAENRAEQAAQRKRIAGLTDALASGPSKALREALDETEAVLALAKKSETDLLDRQEMSDGPVLRRRLSDLRAAMMADPLPREEVNVALRRLLDGVAVDYRTGLLWLRWKHGGDSTVRFAPPEAPEDVPLQWKDDVLWAEHLAQWPDTAVTEFHPALSFDPSAWISDLGGISPSAAPFEGVAAKALLR